MAIPSASRWSWLVCAAGFLCLASVRAAGDPAPGFSSNLPDTWAATDSLGRPVADAAKAGPLQPDRVAGIFYFLWHNKLPKIYDNTKLLAANPSDPQWGPSPDFHYWAEPWCGYYRSDDPWVIRRHAQMLTDAGIDVIVCDCTNTILYSETVTQICEVYTQMRKEGCRTPQIAFILHSHTAQTCQKLYDSFYGANRFPDLWFRWLGKPLLMAKAADVPDTLRDFFTVRDSWAWTGPGSWFGDGDDKWPWIDNTPQLPGWHDAPDKPEEMPIAAGGHPTSNIGRSQHDGTQPPEAEQHPELGQHFDEQIRRALEVKPPFLFVTGWNEWQASRFIQKEGVKPVHFLGRELKPGESFWVDAYNQEFSRDIEPQRGHYEDNYYYQMVDAIRRYKGVRPVPKPSAPRFVGAFSDWADVQPEYRDDPFDTAARDFPGCGDAGVYKNDAGRNDFVRAKVARDNKFVWFYAETREPISPPTGKDWMQLLINADRRADTGWFGYDYVLNRQPGDGQEAVLERFDRAKNTWVDPVRVGLHLDGNRLAVQIPRSAVREFAGRLDFEFKWADNVALDRMKSPAEFMDGGDVAPDGRFNYVFTEGD